MPFVKIFIKIIHSAAPALKQPVDLSVSQEIVTSLIGLISLSSNNENSEMYLLHLTELVILIMKPPAPFTNSKVNIFTYVIELLQNNSVS